MDACRECRMAAYQKTYHPSPQAEAAAKLAIGFVPLVGDAQGVTEFVQNPTFLGAAAIGIGLVPGVGDAASIALKKADDVADVAKEITLFRSAHGEAAEHAADAIAAGKPSVLTIDRAGAAANRQASTGALDTVPDKHLDEYPPAMFKEGGAGASVRPINPRDNMSAGACIGNACRGLEDGTKVRIKIED